MYTNPRVQTAFRLDSGLLNRMKRKARSNGQSLNAIVEDILTKAFPAEPPMPEVAFPLKRSSLTMNFPSGFQLGFPQDVLESDDRLRHILGLDHD